MKFFAAIVPPVQFSMMVSDFQKRYPENRQPGIVEPHITVKTPDGLTDDLSWLVPLREECRKVQPFEVSILQPETFDTSVLYLGIESGKITDLHRSLVECVKPTPAEIRENFELERYEPHLTLAISDDLMTPDLLEKIKKEAESEFTGVFRFNAMFARIFRENPDGSYIQYEDIPFGTAPPSAP